MNEIDFVVIGLRALVFIVVVQAAGGAIFLRLFGRSLSESGHLIRRFTLFAAVAGCVLVVSQHALEPARMTGTLSGVLDGSLQAILLASDAGTARATRVVGLVVIAISAFSKHRLRIQFGTIGAVITIGSFALMGHTATHPYRWILSVLLLVHLLVSAFWFGSLAGFWVTTAKEKIATNGIIVQHFSKIASWLVPLILIAGVGMAIVLIPDFDALRSTYGLLILAKLLGFVGLLFLASWNKVRLGPAILHGSGAALATFRRIVGTEWFVIAAVLALTSVMTGLFSPD